MTANFFEPAMERNAYLRSRIQLSMAPRLHFFDGGYAPRVGRPDRPPFVLARLDRSAAVLVSQNRTAAARDSQGSLDSLQLEKLIHMERRLLVDRLSLA